MDRWDLERPGDRLIEWGAALALGGAGGSAAFALIPSKDFALAPVFGAIATGLAMCLTGLAVMRQAGEPNFRLAEFDPVPFPEAEEPLELMDAISPIDEESRVIRLFAPETIAAPGELAERIDQWLEGARGRTAALAASGDGVPSGHGRTSSAASAALHSALDELRRSLR